MVSSVSYRMDIQLCLYGVSTAGLQNWCVKHIQVTLKSVYYCNMFMLCLQCNICLFVLVRVICRMVSLQQEGPEVCCFVLYALRIRVSVTSCRTTVLSN